MRNNNNNSSRSVTSCIYHPLSTTHSTEQCSRNPSNVRNGSTSPQSSAFSSPQPVSQMSSTSKGPLLCWNCGKEGHTSSRCKAPRATDRTSRSRTSNQLHYIHSDPSYNNGTESISDTTQSDYSQDATELDHDTYLANINTRVNSRLPQSEYDKCVRERRCFRCY